MESRPADAARRAPADVGDTASALQRSVILRRSWPQRLTVLASLAVIVGAIASARTVEHVKEVWEEVDRVVIVGTEQHGGGGAGLLRTATEPGEPVNFLIVGTDSALGLDPDDPVLHQREVDPSGRSLADAIMLLRLDPASESAWVMSIPRDLWAEIPGAQDNKISSALYIGGAELLVATVASMFNVEINHFISMDLAGFKSVVDTLGGVPVWFPNPARDAGSGLNVSTAGCHLLNGEQALQYVRSRRYTELIDGRWQITGGNDFTRIERQQGFLVLALDRAVNRGVRNPSTMLSLLESATDAMTLDQDLTLAELRELAGAFADFRPDNLKRLRLEVYQVRWPDETYKGEAAYKRANVATLDVFRGLADSVRPYEVSLAISGVDSDERADVAAGLIEEGFTVAQSEVAATLAETVLLHGPGDLPQAISLARYLDPLPYVVEAENIEGVVLALGADYRGVLSLYQEPLADVEAKVAARGAPQAVPDAAAILAATPAGAEAAENDAPQALMSENGDLQVLSYSVAAPASLEFSALAGDSASAAGVAALGSMAPRIPALAADHDDTAARAARVGAVGRLVQVSALAQVTEEAPPAPIPGRPPEGQTCS